MFDKNKFAQIIKNIKETYNSQEEFAKKSGIGRTYLSQYMNMKLEEPPKPSILQKLANASNNITSYPELMQLCGYYEENYQLLSAIEKEVMSEYEKDFMNLGFTPFQKDRLSMIINQTGNATLNSESLNKSIIGFTKDFSGKEKEVYGLIMDIFNTITDRYNQQLIVLYDFLSTNTKNKQVYKEKQTSNYYMCPVYGRISAGQPNWAEECIEGRLPIDPELMNIVNPEECFFLRVNGESMNQLVKNGAFALIRKQDTVENGDIAVVLVNGYDATLKKFSKQGDLIVLEPMSNDDSFQTQVYTKDTEIKILGKYIGKMEMK